MEEYNKIFITEANEFIHSLESALLTLENNPEEKKKINEVFRLMHSLKGSGAMFGYDEMSNFTHHLETLFDEVRNGNLKLNQDIISFTLNSLDHIKELLSSDIPVETKKQSEVLVQKIKQFLVTDNQTSEEKSDKLLAKTAPVNNDVIENNNNDKIKTYLIQFKPEKDILENGTNPLYLIDEISKLGKAFIYPDINEIPGLNQIAPFKCYTSWEILLSTDVGVDEINDVFLFVKEESIIKIEKIGDCDIFNYPEIEARLTKERLQLKNIDKKALLGFCMDILTKDQKSKTKSHDPDKTYKNKEESGTSSLPAESFETITEGNKTEKIIESFNENKTISSIRVDSKKLDKLMNLVSEFITIQARLQMYASEKNDPDLLNIAENINKLSRQLRDNTFDICLIPVNYLLTRFRRLVRDLSQELNKEIDFKSEGTDTELDKSVIEKLTDPLLHIIRNAIDHGIESKEKRLALKKPESGKIVLKSYYSGTNVYIIVKDDGKGIDLDKIRAKAVSQNLINKNRQVNKKDLLNMLFLPGFTTSEEISDISGRGVGMDVVKRKIEEIKGEVEIESEKNKGTSIILKLPLTLSIIDGFLVRIGNEHFIVPFVNIQKIYNVKKNDITNKYQNITEVDGKQFQFLDLKKEFNIPSDNEQKNKYMIIVDFKDKQIGLIVDHIFGEYQAVIKPIGDFLKGIDIFSGASILGDGSVALVFDTNKIINHYVN